MNEAADLPDLLARLSEVRASTLSFNEAVVRIGQREDIPDALQDTFDHALKLFMPWKKGPFELCGRLIDAEWRSDWKWERIRPHMQPLADKVVADIGCHNGYYMFRMLAERPRRVVGFEPVAKHALAFAFLNGLAQRKELHFEQLGVEHLHLFPRTFDTIFCLGILYHHTDPVGLLRKIRRALRPGGELIVDCQAIPGDEPMALTPAGRYAGASGVWFVPTATCLAQWLKRAGFQKLRTIHQAPLSIDEQRATPWAPIDSLAAFLDPKDLTRTIEGYPAPLRVYMLAG